MPEPITLSLFLTQAIGGVTGALAQKGSEAAPGMAARLRRSTSLVEQPTLTQIDGAVAQAVDMAMADVRKTAINDLPGATLDEATHSTLEDLIRLLDHAPFAGEVTQRLLYRGQPEFERLRLAYLN